MPLELRWNPRAVMWEVWGWITGRHFCCLTSKVTHEEAAGWCGDRAYRTLNPSLG